MKKKILSILLIAVLISSYFIPTKVQANDVTNDDWIQEKLSDYEPLQQLLEEHPDAKLVESKTEYILNAITQDSAGNVIKSEKKAFSDLNSLYNYKSTQESLQSLAGPYIVEPGGTTYVSYGWVRVGLSTYKYTNTQFFVAAVYDWLQVPIVNSTIYMGLVGLAFDSNLSMINGTYAGRASLYRSSGSIAKQYTTNAGNLSIGASAANAIAFSFTYITTIPGEVADMDGVISCTALKNSQNPYCNAFGEYDDVTVGLGNFSVSYPAGISVGPTTIRDRYTIQDSLNVR